MSPSSRSTASAVTGAGITLTASQPIFEAGHIGSLILLEDPDPGKIKPYQPAETIVINSQQRNGGNVYQALAGFTWAAGDTTQRYVPVHTEGTANDGEIDWLYLHSGYGWAQITAVGEDTSLTFTFSRKAALQIGTLGGYSTIWMAQALPADGRLISLEFEPKHAEVARSNVARA